MKKFSKVMALVLCLAMVFVLCACGGSDTEKFIGTWEAEVDMTDTIMESLEDELEGIMDYFEFGKFMFTMTMTFNEDGTYEMTMALTEDSAADYNAALEEGMRAAIEDSIAAEVELYGMTMEEYEEAYLSLYGVTLKEDVDAIVEESMSEIDIQELMADATVEGKWKAESGKLYMTDDVDDDFEDDSYDIYENLTDSAFTLVDELDDGETVESNFYPLTFSKVS